MVKLCQQDNDENIGVEFQQYSDGMHLAAAYVKNALGDVVGTYDVMSGVTLYREYCYDAYGNAVEEYDFTDTTPPSENPFRYRGEYYDTETGLYYLRNRYYDPQTGRFITEDPIRDGNNWYVYCNGNPVMFRDPTGLFMPGDENRSAEANAIIFYYTKEYEKAEAAYMAATEGEKAQYRERLEYCHAQAEFVRNCDDNGISMGTILNVYNINQYEMPDSNITLEDSQLCWAACAASVESWYADDTVNRIEQIAISVSGSNDPAVYNKTAGHKDWKSHVGFDSTKTDLRLSMSELTNEIDNGNPVIANFDNSDPTKAGHSVVVVGQIQVNNEKGTMFIDPEDGGLVFMTQLEFSTISNYGRVRSTITTKGR